MSEQAQALADDDVIDTQDVHEPDDAPEIDTDDEGDGYEPEPEFDEVEIEGKAYKLPKELKDKVMMHADYTRKTQEVAEQRKAVEAKRAEIEALSALSTQNFEAKAELHALTRQIAEYENVDWARLHQENPQLAQQHQFRLMQLQGQAQKKQAELQQHESTLSNQQRQLAAKRMEESRRQLTSEIPDWSADRAKEVASQSKNLGFSQEFIKALDSGMFPDAVPMIKALHKASLYDQMIAKAKKATKQTVEVQPSKEVKGKATVKKSIYDKNLTTAERIALFKKGKKPK